MFKPTKPTSRTGSLTPAANTAPAPSTRKNRSQNMGILSREEALTKAPGNLRAPEKAMAYLSEHGYAPDGADLSLHTIAFILFQLAAGSSSATDSDGIKAVAYLLEELDIHGIAQNLSDRVTDKISDKINDVGQALIDAKENEVAYLKMSGELQQKGLQAVREEILEAAAQLAKGTEEMEGTQNSMENTVGEIAEFFQQSIVEIKEQVAIITSPESYGTTPRIALPITSLTPSQPQPTDTFSYAQVTGQHLPSTHASNITRNNDKRRQFTIQPANRDEDMGLDALSELEIIAKLKLAYETMTVGKDTAPEEVRFTSVRRMKKGGILFDLNTDEAADWLRDEDTQRDFTKHFSATAVVQGYQFRVLAEFVPVSFDADSQYAAANIEEANYLPAGSIAEVGWVKRTDRCSATQQVAHLKISFVTIGQANDAIEKGLSIQGKGVNVRQMIVEPQRCAKCQLYGHDNNKGAPHFARNCAWTHDTCGLCSGMHRTSECKVAMPGGAQCANCKIGGREYRGHTVHSRSCPTFLEMKSRYDRRHGTQQYRFFVTEDARTWETNPTTTSTLETARPSTQPTQHYPTPPPNQLQHPVYSRPPPGSRGPPRQTPQRGDNSGPRGIQLSAANSARRQQGTLNRWMAIANTLAEDDEVDAEIEATDTLITTARPANEVAQGDIATWADDSNQALPSSTFDSTPVFLTAPGTSSTQLTQTALQGSLGSSPMRFPSSTPSTPKPVSR